MIPFRNLYRVLLFLCLLPLCSPAQNITGDIRGIVHDPSGAIVPNASVEVKNIDQNAVLRTLKTGADGSYVAALLPVGRYQLVVTASGFDTLTTNPIALNVNDRRVVDLTLKLGSTSQVVNVEEANAQINLDTPEAAGVISGTQIRELSVLSRNFVQLVPLQPGVTTDMATDQLYVGASNPTGFSNQINISINGNRPTQNSWLIDGADDFDRGANLTLLNYPSVDSIAEFKVLRSNYLPEHGRTSSGEISVITRGGTNQFHGNAYEFFRNDKLNANDYFLNNAGIPRQPLRWNDFGFTIGGPIVKNKTFFFYSQEWRRFSIFPTQSSSIIPTAAEQGGVFPVPVCVSFDTAGNCTGTGQTITNINPTAAAYIQDIFSKLPAPNQPDQTLVSASRSTYNYREEAVRIDQNFGQKFTIFGRYTDDSIPTFEPSGLYTGVPLPGVASTSTNAPGRNLSVRGTWTISSNLLNDIGYAFSWGAVLSDPVGTMAVKNSPDILPTITLPYSSSAATVPFIDLGDGSGQSLYGFGSYRDYNKNHTIFDNLSWIKGHHSLKFGVTYNYYTKDENANNGATFSFLADDGSGGAVNSGFEQVWANFLLGRVYNYNQAQNEFRYLIHQHQAEFYAQDEWRVRPNFTLDFGVRYSLFMAPTYGNNLLSTFDANLYNASSAPVVGTDGFYPTVVDTTALPGLIQGGHNSPYGDAVVPTQKLDFAPRVGFAWDPFGTGKTSIRAGYGIFYDSLAVNNHEQAQESNPSVSNTANIYFTNLSNPAGGTMFTNFAPPVVWGPNPTQWKTPYSQMFDLDIQQQLTPTTTFDIGYYGNLGRHLIGVVDVNMPQPLAFRNIPNYGDCSTNPNCTFNAFDYQQLNYVRPYQGYDAINLFSNVFTSNYNGLQASLQKQFSASSLVTLNYTWSHDLTTASGDYRSAQDTYNLLGDYGNSDFDRRQVFTGSYVYTLPFYKNQQGFAGHVLGGWELSGIVYLNTGRHYTATISSCAQDRAGLGLCGNTNSGARPDIIGDPNANAPHKVDQWFNTGAFATVPSDQARVGTEGRGTIVGPGTMRWDASIFKNTKLTERISTQFRAEFFNALNHTNFGQGAPASAFASLRSTSSLFGRIANARDPRQIQLALKLIF